MAYAIKYYIRFKNRFQRDIYRVEIWERDFAGDATELTGAGTPFTLTSNAGDTNILTPIKSISASFSFNTNTLSIEDFYSDDDEKYRVDFYFESLEDLSGTEQLLFSGFMVQEDASEAVIDIKHVITLRATDNIALLKNVKWNEVAYYDDFPIIHQHPILNIIQFILNKTNLYNNAATIDKSLPLRIYDNLFETTTTDRGDADTNDPLLETVLFTGMFQNSDGTYNDCYAILEDILKGFNACLFQADGCWNIARIPEYRLFTDGAIPGTQYNFNGTTTDITAVTLNPFVVIDRGGDVEPVNEDQLKSIERPLKYVKNTFNYNHPAFIPRANLQMEEGATPYDTSTVGDIRFDKYSLADYFPEWTQRQDDISYLQTEFSISENREIDRYIVTPGIDSDSLYGVQFPAIPVTKNDKLNFTLRLKMLSSSSETLRFFVKFILMRPDGGWYNLFSNGVSLDGAIFWTGSPNPSTTWDTGAGNWLELSSSADKTIWTDYDLFTLDGITNTTDVYIPFPEDGMLMIQVLATAPSAAAHVTTVWKDINFTIDQFINNSTQIIGQTHKDSGNVLAKAIEENDIDIDDSPRNTIAGTLFTDALTNFDYTDITTGADTNIGDVYFTRTALWHRGPIVESKRLGNIITQERILLRSKSRLQIEGTFENIRIDTAFISLLSFFQFGWIPTKYFIPASFSLDYMADTFNARFVEIYNTADVTTLSVFLTGAKEEQLGITNGTITYDTITYYGGAEDYLTPSISNSRFTYNGFDTTLDLSVILYVPISGSGTATFDLLKNGVSIATQTVNAAAVFAVVSFDVPGEAVTDTDYFEASVDTGGADVDIQSGSINITVNNVTAEGIFPYLFNYLYQTN
jgi:hypothetical protein